MLRAWTTTRSNGPARVQSRIETDTGDATNSRVVPVSQERSSRRCRLAESVPAFLRHRGMLQPHERVLTWGADQREVEADPPAHRAIAATR